jgi:hypothetical protein
MPLTAKPAHRLSITAPAREKGTNDSSTKATAKTKFRRTSIRLFPGIKLTSGLKGIILKNGW